MKRFLFIVTILISISSSAQSYYDNIDLLLHEDIWSIDTLTKVDDIQYYYASSAFKNIIYNDFNILLISNTIHKPYDKEYRKLPIFTYNDSTFIVDFSKDSSVNSLLSKEQYNSNFYRVWKDFVYKVNDWFKLKHSVYIDFPKYYYAYASNIREWLIKKIECSFYSNDGNVYTDLESIGINSPNDNEIINFSAYKYFQTVLRDFQNSEFYGSQWWFYYELSLEVHTDRFVTYKYYRSRYEGGAHDAYSRNYITYDYINNREYDIEDLIKPEYLNRVKEILLITAY